MITGFTDQDYLKFGFGSEFRPFREQPSDQWRVAYDSKINSIDSFRQECLLGAAKIRESTDLPIQILFSGGSDSEICVRSFMEQGIPIECVIIEFEHGENQHDIVSAYRFCQSYGLKTRVLRLNIEEFFESGQAYEYAKVAGCVSPALLHHMWAIDQLDGFPILGAGENHIEKQRKFSSDCDWDFYDEEFFYSWHRFLMARNRPGVPAFFQYTPGMVLSHLNLPQIDKLLKHQYPVHFNSSGYIKTEIYRNEFNIQCMQEECFNGFEYLLETFANCHARLIHLYGTQIQRISVADVRSQIQVVGERHTASMVSRLVEDHV